MDYIVDTIRAAARWACSNEGCALANWISAVAAVVTGMGSWWVVNARRRRLRKP